MDSNGPGTSLAVIPARPTIYGGVRMRSRLEAAYAEQFDAFGWKWQYEPECFATPEDGQYLPDFRLHLQTGSSPVYVEVKPFIDLDQFQRCRDDLARWWRITQACDPRAVAFLLCFGQALGNELLWYGMLRGWDHCRTVAPRRRAQSDRHVIASEDRSSLYGITPLTEPAAPVASLHGQRFAFLPVPDDPFAIAVDGL